METSWGNQWDNVDMQIVRAATKGIKGMDDEHGAFWVGIIKEQENVLEVYKDLRLLGIFEDEPGIQYSRHARDWGEVEVLFYTLMSDQIEVLKSQLKRG